ncbi:MAG: SusC/RagA family TonB-linked outer membrane protein [Prevotellaceae bacterium]|nr:SusC/RagA family TonB-linked outer membrane protein [Prevotellaceae bacterium]
MKKTFIMLSFLFGLSLAGSPLPMAMAQTVKKTIKIEIKSEKLTDALKRLEKLSGYKILFSYDELGQFKVTNKSVKTNNVRQALDALLQSKPLTYRIQGKYINVYLKEEAQRTAQAQARQNQSVGVRITGHVLDETREPLPGATVRIAGATGGLTTGIDGRFTFVVQRGKPVTLQFSYVGYGTVTRNFDCEKDETGFEVILAEEASLKEVVVNGIFERRKESFTGSTVTFNKEELNAVGNQNVLKSLKNLDPSFQIVENLEMGSDPNSMPNLQLRGQTSFNIAGDYDGNANQPLFILDGFETSLEKIWDLDMNRVQSVTILKDAAAKAVYGSKAGNGVVVIETERPKSGKLRIAYNGNLNIEAPDLTGYNLMNAREKYDWEIEHGKYSNWQALNSPHYSDLLRKSVYDAIESGVDTYWLSKPLRTGVGQKHTLQLEGGDSKVRYILGASYNRVNGAMKGSDRETFNINSTLSYTYKNMVFRNMMDYTRNNSKNSPYGSFSDYVALEPYFAPYDENGNAKRLLGYETVLSSGFASPVYNPLYNATLNTKDESNYTSFTDNFEMDWHINDNFRMTAKMSYTRLENGADVFLPASHTMFIDYDDNGNGDRKGRYTKTDGNSSSFSMQAGLSWNKTFGKHSVYANGAWNIQTVNSRSTTVMAEGFGNDNMDDISMATYYYHDSHPTGSDTKTREVGLIGSLNYSYADRYLVDASIRRTGSSVYGSDNHWGTFWSVGAGWNLHNEKWFGEDSQIKMLKLRWSLGYTGTQNFNPYQARAKYLYGATYYDGRLGATLMALPNTALKWQRVYDNNFGLDLAISSWLTARVDYYIQNTDNLLSDITLPASTGFNSYKENMGEIENKGIELSLSVTPWRDNSTRSWLTFTASAAHNKNEIKKIYDIFKKSNDEADKNFDQDMTGQQLSASEYNKWMTQSTRPATKYYEGCSMTAIWGVRSLGIDPMSGNEMYLDKNGNVTYTWSADDQVVIGDINPDWHGTFGISGAYHGWTFSLVASYNLGGDIYNSTLIDRVENITGFGNLDKRVYDVLDKAWR